MTLNTPRRGPKKGEPKNHGRPCSLAEFRRLWHDMSLTKADLAASLRVTERTVSERAKACGFTPRTALRGDHRCHFDDEFAAIWAFGVNAEAIGAHWQRRRAPSTMACLLPPLPQIKPCHGQTARLTTKLRYGA